MGLWKKINTDVTIPKQDAWAEVAIALFCAPLAVYSAIHGDMLLVILSVGFLLNSLRAFWKDRAIKASQKTQQRKGGIG
jgi:hypothetical protein